MVRVIGMYEIAALQNIFVRRLLETSDVLEASSFES